MTKPVDIGMLELKFREAIWREVVRASTPEFTDTEIKFALRMAYLNTRKRLQTRRVK